PGRAVQTCSKGTVVTGFGHYQRTVGKHRVINADVEAKVVQLRAFRRDEVDDRLRVSECPQKKEQLADVDAGVVDCVGKALFGDTDTVAVEQLRQQHPRQRHPGEVDKNALLDLVQGFANLRLRVQEPVDVVHLQAIGR